MKVRYTPKFLKRHQGLEDGEANVEGVRGMIKISITNQDGRCFWAFFDSVELANESLAQVPWSRVEELGMLSAFKRFMDKL